MIHLGFERDYSLSNLNRTGLVNDSLFCQLSVLLLYLSSMLHFFHSHFPLCHSKPIPSCHMTVIFNFISHYVRIAYLFSTSLTCASVQVTDSLLFTHKTPHLLYDFPIIWSASKSRTKSVSFYLQINGTYMRPLTCYKYLQARGRCK